MKIDTTRVPRHRSLSVKLMAVLALVVVAAFATVGHLTLRVHTQQSIALVAQNLDTLVDTVRASTRYHMLRAAHEDVAEIVRTVGRQREVERVRLIAKDGRVWMSGRPEELGVILSVRDPACAGCHQSGPPKPALDLHDRMSTYERDGRSFMTIIRPIYNEPECASGACHVHPAGQMGDAARDRNDGEDRRRYALVQDAELGARRHHARGRHFDALHGHREHVAVRGALDEHRSGGGVDPRPVHRIRRRTSGVDLPGEAVGSLKPDATAGEHAGSGCDVSREAEHMLVVRNGDHGCRGGTSA